MKRSVSSVLAERIRQRKAVTPAKHKVRYVKFTPEEMAYDIPDDTSHFVPVGRGENALFAKPPANWARIDPELRKAFPSDRVLNEALKKVVELQQLKTSEGRRKKSA
jgi:hypothetical protein